MMWNVHESTWRIAMDSSKRLYVINEQQVEFPYAKSVYFLNQNLLVNSISLVPGAHSFEDLDNLRSAVIITVLPS